jgi:hypothetical protein
MRKNKEFDMKKFWCVCFVLVVGLMVVDAQQSGPQIEGEWSYTETDENGEQTEYSHDSYQRGRSMNSIFLSLRSSGDMVLGTAVIGQWKVQGDFFTATFTLNSDEGRTRVNLEGKSITNNFIFGVVYASAGSLSWNSSFRLIRASQR